jgi:hypothetical protein
MRYRFGYFYAGLVLAQSNWLINVTPQDDTGEATGDSQEYFAVQASGYGGNFGIQIPVSARSLLYIDTVYSSQPTAQIQARATDHPGDIAAPEEVVLGSRMSVDIGGSLDITRNLIDGVAGFKYRTYSLAVDGTSYIEQHHTTYLGLRFGWTF